MQKYLYSVAPTITKIRGIFSLNWLQLRSENNLIFRGLGEKWSHITSTLRKHFYWILFSIGSDI